ncbi:hypothetical protein GW17_00060019 [Ensete ventricosum]|nr:hypothetical protein GW17_00060019 [Ensete ventricosum]
MTTLTVTISEEPQAKTLMVTFMVVNLTSTYNAIIDRSTLNKLRTVVSTFNRSMKFPTMQGSTKPAATPGSLTDVT